MDKLGHRAFLVAAVVLTLVGAACSNDNENGGGGGGGGDSSAATTVNSTMKDFSIALDSASAASGEVKFEITNEGPSEHEFVVLKTDTPAGELPVENNEVTEDASGITVAGEAEDIASGASVSLTLDLEPGSYAVICNIPAHYGQGMWASFTVS